MLGSWWWKRKQKPRYPSLQVHLPRNAISVAYPAELPAESIVVEGHLLTPRLGQLFVKLVNLGFVFASDENRYRGRERESMRPSAVHCHVFLPLQCEDRVFDHALLSTWFIGFVFRDALDTGILE